MRGLGGVRSAFLLSQSAAGKGKPDIRMLLLCTTKVGPEYSVSMRKDKPDEPSDKPCGNARTEGNTIHKKNRMLIEKTRHYAPFVTPEFHRSHSGLLNEPMPGI